METILQKKRQFIYEWAIFVIILLGITPALTIGGYVTPLQYLMLPLFALALVMAFLNELRFPKNGKVFFYLWILIICEVLFAALFAPLYHFGFLGFPSEGIQYAARFLTFFAFMIVYYNYNFGSTRFLYALLIVLVVGMLIGVIQWFDWSGNRFLWEQYTYSDRYFSHFFRGMTTRRVPGVAHMPTANGGLAAFVFIIGTSALLFLKRHRFLALTVMALAVINTIASQARMGYLTIFFSLFVFYILWVYLYRNAAKPTAVVVALSGGAVLALGVLYRLGNVFVLQAMERWESLFLQVAAGSNRLGQIYAAIKTLDGPFDFFFGISRGVQTETDGLLIEIEPVNILVLYGIIGFILQYGLVILLLLYFMKHLQLLKNEPVLLTLAVASFVSLISYQFFSMSYYFFREVYVGLFPWILMGATIGMVERYKKIDDAGHLPEWS